MVRAALMRPFGIGGLLRLTKSSSLGIRVIYLLISITGLIEKLYVLSLRGEEKNVKINSDKREKQIYSKFANKTKKYCENLRNMIKFI